MEAADRTRVPGIPPFAEREECRRFHGTHRQLDVMQANICRCCNLACKHCHLKAGPDRTELMRREVMDACLALFERNRFQTLDITGGAPEMHPDFRRFVAAAVARGIRIIVRTNLVVLCEDAHRGLPDFYAENRIELVASLPYYTESDTDRQRGKGVFAACLSALRALNALGYGRAPDLPLQLVYNPGGAFLPPNQDALAAEYRKKLSDAHGVAFNNLYAIANNPIGRFGDFLERSDNLTGYMKRLAAAFNPAAVENMMCRKQISVDWDGTIYDCDFNLALGLRAAVPARVQDLGDAVLAERRIAFADHCYACTAGAGSSCGGATA